MKETIYIDSYEFRQKMAHFLNKAKYGDKELIIQRRKKSIAKVIPIIDEENKDNE